MTPDPPNRLRWGILGTGNIASQFANDLAHSATGTLRGVASRDPAKAARWLTSLHDPQPPSCTPFPDYQSLLHSPEIDAVYIALPNTLHSEWTSRAIRAGKHVLCEKPLAITAAEAEALFELARAQEVVLIEGFMYRAHPQTQLLRETLTSGRIGKLRLMQINFCFDRPATREDSRYHPDEGGGSLMDVGCYCLDLARYLTGEEPDHANGLAHRHDFGVDDCFAGSMVFPGGTLVSFVSGMTITTDQITRLYGTEGWIEIPRFWKAAEGFVIHRPGRAAETIRLPDNPPRPPLYAVEADAFASVLAGAENWNPPENTIANLRLLETLRPHQGPS